MGRRNRNDDQNSAVARRHLVGRVEHVMSGVSEPFASLDALLAFMARFTAAGAPAEPTAKNRKEDADEPQ